MKRLAPKSRDAGEGLVMEKDETRELATAQEKSIMLLYNQIMSSFSPTIIMHKGIYVNNRCRGVLDLNASPFHASSNHFSLVAAPLSTNTV
jgi:hypothetical protein